MAPRNDQNSPFPILVIAVLSITGTAFLLLLHYIFIVKCCSGFHLLDRLIRRLSPREDDDPFIAISPRTWNHGMDQSAIHEIPIFQYRRRDAVEWCVICMNEFHEKDVLRALPRCRHGFHLDCIDVWLQSNSNCPLCRSSISGSSQYPSDQIIAPSSSPQDSIPYSDSILGGDENFVVIELGGGSRNLASSASVRETCQSPRKLEKKLEKPKPRKRDHVSVMGDECIDIGKKDEQFYIQPIRRSFSLDSAKSQLLYLMVQTVFRQNMQQSESSTSQRSSHSFRHSQGSRNAVFLI